MKILLLRRTNFLFRSINICHLGYPLILVEIGAGGREKRFQVHLHRRLASGASFRVIDHAAAFFFFFYNQLPFPPSGGIDRWEWRIRKKQACGGGDLKREQVQKLNSKRMDRPASGVTHKFPRRSYNLLLNYSLSRGAAAPPSHSLLSISPDIDMHASKIDAFAPATLAPIPETEVPRDRFHSFHPSGQSIRDSKIYPPVPLHSA